MNHRLTAEQPVYPTTIPILREYCTGLEQIGGDYRFGMAFYFHNPSRAKLLSELFTWGEYGVQLVHPKTQKVLARAGFEVDEGIMKITHTPQGVRPREMLSDEDMLTTAQEVLRQEELTGRERRRLKRLPFRIEMMGHMIAVARALRLEFVHGSGAKNHDKVKSKQLTLKQAIRIMDGQFISSGFEPDENGNFVLRLG